MFSQLSGSSDLCRVSLYIGELYVSSVCVTFCLRAVCVSAVLLFSACARARDGRQGETSFRSGWAFPMRRQNSLHEISDHSS